jgi:Protein of unknown function (DUF2786)
MNRAPSRNGAAPAPPRADEEAAQLVGLAVQALDVGRTGDVVGCVHRLAADRGAGWARQVDGALEGALTAGVTALWRSGWQPADLLRLVARRFRPPHEQLVRVVLAQDLAGYAPATVDPRWAAQLAEADDVPRRPSGSSAVPDWLARQPDRAEALLVAVELLRALRVLPALQVLLPLPGTAVAAPAGPPREVDERVLARVRALLAKAESTTFPAEAETFTAGAQALMARHSIDHAMLAAAGRVAADEPAGRRIGIDNPYEAPKATLLDAVASANRSRAVWAKELGFATVVGHPTDLDTVEVLFTSLLVQASAAMTAAGSRTYRDGASRTRSAGHRGGGRAGGQRRSAARAGLAGGGRQPRHHRTVPADDHADRGHRLGRRGLGQRPRRRRPGLARPRRGGHGVTAVTASSPDRRLSVRKRAARSSAASASSRRP